MPKHNCCPPRHDYSSDDNSDDCSCSQCNKPKVKKHCSRKSNCQKNRCCECSKNRPVIKKKCKCETHCDNNVIDFCKKDCNDGKVILISIN